MLYKILAPLVHVFLRKTKFKYFKNKNYSLHFCLPKDINIIEAKNTLIKDFFKLKFEEGINIVFRVNSQEFKGICDGKKYCESYINDLKENENNLDLWLLPAKVELEEFYLFGSKKSYGVIYSEEPKQTKELIYVIIYLKIFPNKRRSLELTFALLFESNHSMEELTSKTMEIVSYFKKLSFAVY